MQSMTIFIGLLILLSLFIVQIIMLFFIGQHLFALFLLGVYVGAILVFFIFVVMSFVFFGKSYKLTFRLWSLYMIIPIIYICYFYKYYFYISLSLCNCIFFSDSIFILYCYSIFDLGVLGYLLFEYDMVYIILVLSLLLFVALIGSVTLNASSLVRYSCSIYIKD